MIFNSRHVRPFNKCGQLGRYRKLQPLLKKSIRSRCQIPNDQSRRVRHQCDPNIVNICDSIHARAPPVFQIPILSLAPCSHHHCAGHPGRLTNSYPRLNSRRTRSTTIGMAAATSGESCVPTLAELTVTRIQMNSVSRSVGVTWRSKASMAGAER